MGYSRLKSKWEKEKTLGVAWRFYTDLQGYMLCVHIYIYIYTRTGHVFIFVRCDEIMIMKHRSCQRYDILLIGASKGLEMCVFFQQKLDPELKNRAFGALSTSRSWSSHKSQWGFGIVKCYLPTQSTRGWCSWIHSIIWMFLSINPFELVSLFLGLRLTEGVTPWPLLIFSKTSTARFS